MKLTVLAGEYSVWRLAADAPLPAADPGCFLSLTRTEDELSIVALSTEVPADAITESGWRCLKVEGPLPFDMTGVLAALSTPLADAGISIFVISTYDTDYLLVKSADLERSCRVLRDAGHTVGD